MILSARFVKQPQNDNLPSCDDCEYPIFGPHIRLYGMAHQEEKPFNIYLHTNCAENSIDISQEPKIEQALTLANGPQSVFI